VALEIDLAAGILVTEERDSEERGTFTINRGMVGICKEISGVVETIGSMLG
jgi:hypothetical protein